MFVLYMDGNKIGETMKGVDAPSMLKVGLRRLTPGWPYGWCLSSHVQI